MTEDAFQSMLDDDPADSGTRLVFADWLEDQGDWRAAGYRWMGDHGKWPYLAVSSYGGYSWRWWGGESGWASPYVPRPNDHALLPMAMLGGYADAPTRRAAEESLCRAVLAMAQAAA